MAALLRAGAVAQRLGIHRSTIYRLMDTDAEFPRPVRVTGVHGQFGGAVAWPEDEIAQYVEKLIAKRDSAVGSPKPAARKRRRQRA